MSRFGCGLIPLALVVMPVGAQSLGSPVGDVTHLAQPDQRTPVQNPYQRILIPEQTPSGMTIYREPPPGSQVPSPRRAQEAKGTVPRK